MYVCMYDRLVYVCRYIMLDWSATGKKASCSGAHLKVCWFRCPCTSRHLLNPKPQKPSAGAQIDVIMPLIPSGDHRIACIDIAYNSLKFSATLQN